MTAGKRIRSGGRLRSAHIGQLASSVNSTSACFGAVRRSPRNDEYLVVRSSSWFGVDMVRHRRARASHHHRSEAPGSFWLYGTHPARAALRNPRRSILRGVITEAAWRELGRDWREGLEPQIVPAEKVGQMLPPGAVHQGVAI